MSETAYQIQSDSNKDYQDTDPIYRVARFKKFPESN